MKATSQPDATKNWLAADLGPGVTAWFTARSPGHSVAEYAGLNLGLHVGDDAQAVRANRAEVAAQFGRPVAFGHQVHGRQTLTLLAYPAASTLPVTANQQGVDLHDHDLERLLDSDLGNANDLSNAAGSGCDALVTRRTDVAVGVLVADCVPILLADADAGVVGAAHAGRVGLLGGVIESAVAAMVDQGARPSSMAVALGPAAGPCCYEVPESMATEAAAQVGELAARTRWGTAALDLRAGCQAKLLQLGVKQVQLVGGCTIEDQLRFSYRRAATTGRFAGVIATTGPKARMSAGTQG